MSNRPNPLPLHDNLINYHILPINRTVHVEVGKIFCGRDVGNLPFYYTHLNDCRSECIRSHCTLALSLFSLIRHMPHVKRSFIGELYDHAANMNSESAKELLKLLNSVLVCRQGKRKDM